MAKHCYPSKRQSVAAVLVILAAPAMAASVDLTINSEPSKASFNYTEPAVHTVVIGNRGPETATNAQLTFSNPISTGSTVAWNTRVTCTASGGAVCPANYTLDFNATRLTATIPSIPLGGQLTLSVPAAIYTNLANPPSTFPITTSTSRINASSADTELEPATNVAVANYRVHGIGGGTPVDYSVTSTPFTTTPISGTSNTKVTSLVTVHNNLAQVNSLLTTFEWTPFPGLFQNKPAFVSASTPYGFDISDADLAINCVGGTGGAQCSNATNVDAKSVYTPSMPAGSSLTFEVSATVGKPVCADGSVTREVQLRAEVGPNTNPANGPLGAKETTGTSADNYTQPSPSAAFPAPPCLKGDLIMQSIVNVGTPSYGASKPFELKATYANSAGSIAGASNVPLMFWVDWPGESKAVIDPTQITCEAFGGATCPTTWAVSPYTPSIVSAFAPNLPTNSQLVVTFRGTTGGDDTKVCRPQKMNAQADIVPPPDFKDSVYDPYSSPQYRHGIQTKGNNAYQLTLQADIGSNCSPSYDLQVQKTGPFSDVAATKPVTVIRPGDWIYFRSIYTLLAGSAPLWQYSMSDEVLYYSNRRRTADEQIYPHDRFPDFLYDQGSPINPILMRGREGDPPGLKNLEPYGSNIPTFDLGIRCTAKGGATCPTTAYTGGSGGGGSSYFQASGWNLGEANWPGGQPVWPAGGELELIYSYRVPQLPEGVTCAFDPQQTYPKNRTTADGRSDPVGSERNNSNNVAQVLFDIKFWPPECHSDSVPSLIKSANVGSIPADGKVTYTVTLANTSARVIDVPRLRDAMYPAGIDDGVSATITNCVAEGGARCPPYTPLQGIKYTDNGATQTFTTALDFNLYGSEIPRRPDFDFSWGKPGDDTMPTDSKVTFTISVQYPPTQKNAGNGYINYVTAESGANSQYPFERLKTSVAIYPPSSAKLPLLVNKNVSPQQAQPGSTVTYAVTLINPNSTNLTSLAFSDVLPAGLQAANPSGYGNLSCVPLTVADGQLPAPMGNAVCPQFNSDAAGITALVNLPGNSGLRLTYTAVAPAPGGYSLDNVASLRHSEAAHTDGDSGAQANFGAAPLPLLPDLTSDIADIPNADSTPVGSTVTVSVTYDNIGAGVGHDAVPTLQLPPGLSGVAPSNDGSYDAATGLVTWPTISVFAPNAPVTYSVSFIMPSATVPMRSYITGSNEPDTVLANNPDTASLSNAATPVQPPTPIPTLSEWSLMALSLLLIGMAGRQRRRR